MLDILRQTENIEEISHTRLFVYSGNDQFLVWVLLSLGILDRSCINRRYSESGYGSDNKKRCLYDFPTPASNLIFELSYNEDIILFMMLRYNGESVLLYGLSFRYEEGVVPI